MAELFLIAVVLMLVALVVIAVSLRRMLPNIEKLHTIADNSNHYVEQHLVRS